MPFVAINTTTSSRMHISQVPKPLTEVTRDCWACQLCEQPMLIRGGVLVRRHFYHLQQCSTDYRFHADTAEHLLGKDWIVQQLQHELWGYTGADIEMEVPIPEIKRVADVLVTFPNGWRIAHACQLTPISLDEIKQCTAEYVQQGIDLYWWMGLSALNKPGVKDWLVSTYGFALIISFTETGERL